MKKEFKNARGLVERCLNFRYFLPEKGKKAAIPFIFAPAVKETPFVVVTGENGGGKSFFRRIASEIAKRNDVESIPISMEARANLSSRPWLALVYGSEEWQATGVNSINTVLTGIKTCQGRTTPHVVIWDEPDLGLSEGNAASVGRAIANMSPNEHSKAVIVMTHRKALVAELAKVNPHYLFLGSDKGPKSLQEWLDAPLVYQDLEQVADRSHRRFLAIQKILDSPKRG